MKPLKAAVAICTAGAMWYLGLYLFFVWSGAQNILGNPKYQSKKFFEVFATIEPLPRMVTEPTHFMVGFAIVGAIGGSAFLLVNKYLPGNWLKKGLIFGVLHWMLMTPWFEFYLPYNVMHEPLLLVLMEAGLWLCLALFLGLYLSFVVNFKTTGSRKSSPSK